MTPTPTPQRADDHVQRAAQATTILAGLLTTRGGSLRAADAIDWDAVLAQAKALESAGCQLRRMARTVQS